MGNQGYVDPLINEIAQNVQLILFILAYAFNILLIFIILRCSAHCIGKYRVLLTFFALSDLYYNTLHFLVYPIPEMYGNAFFMRGHGYYQERLGVALYLGAYGHAFPILIFHFLYRLLVIYFHHIISYFPSLLLAFLKFSLRLSIFHFSIFYWFFQPDSESLLILAPLFDGSTPVDVVHSNDTAHKHAQALYWASATFEGPRWWSLTGAGLMCLAMVSAYVAIVSCCFLVNKYLKSQTKRAFSMRLHKQLFRSLIYQAFVPLFTAYYPAMTSVMLPVFGITIPYISVAVPPACATHPLVDPLLLIFTITEYRLVF
ncbi:hypothetical protein PMAYCL1PPCAC_16735, partial [Pristionchus mayeri]